MGCWDVFLELNSLNTRGIYWKCLSFLMSNMEENDTWHRNLFETEDKHCWHAGHEQIHVANYAGHEQVHVGNYCPMFTVIRSQLAHALTFNPSPGSVDKITYHLCSCAIFTISPLIKITQWEKKQQKQQLTTNNLLLGDAFSLYTID